MSRGQYPFWKDQEIARTHGQAMRYYQEVPELKKKLKNIKCPKCGHIFDIVQTTEV